jgi:hypothetical protein
MSFTAGQRVYFDLDSDFNEQLEAKQPPPLSASSTDFIGDIKEHDPSAIPPPPAPSFKANATGFPAHKKRTNRVSAFKQQRANGGVPVDKPKVAANKPGTGFPLSEDERMRIDQENRQVLAQMSPEEIERERQELLEGLSPGLIEKLLARTSMANLDDGSNERDWDKEVEVEKATALAAEPEQEQEQSERKKSTKKVMFDTPDEPELESTAPEDDIPPPPSEPQEPTQPADSATSTLPDTHLATEPSSIHFPQPPQPPDLDPSSETFLTDLHSKYFPDLPYDPSTVSWMTPIDPSDTSSPYHPSQQALAPSDLRFDFKGSLLPPSLARQIPVTKGLHHHSEAPEAAGYTVPELARLARSAVPAQRCVAYQTLGRILYRLGKGEFGVEEGRQGVDGPVRVAKRPVEDGDEEAVDDEGDDESVGSFMAAGLWDLMEGFKIVEILTEEANRERGHLSARTYAQEALWNWRRGGGRRRKAV